MKKIISLLIVIAFISYPFQYAQAVQNEYCGTTSGASGVWWFDESSGNAADQTANAYTLTNNGTATYVTDDANPGFGNGGSLGTSNSTKWFANASSLGWEGGNVSISLWVKILTDSGTQEIFQLEDPTTTKTALLIRYDGTTLILYRYRINVGVISVSETVTLGTSAWHHLVATYNSSSGDMILYRNNVSKGTATATLGGNATTDPAHFSLGKSLGSDIAVDNYASAVYDEVVVSSNVFASGDVADIYNRVQPPIGCAAAATGGGIFSPIILME